jgi:hypothetical protein
MRRIRVYVDTSVFGGTTDVEFADESDMFFHHVRQGRFVVIVYSLVFRELSLAPQAVQDVLLGLDADCVERMEPSVEVDALAEAYIAAGILEAGSRDDAIHVAAASVAGAELILSWNFRHIVNYNRIPKYNLVNALKGYRQIEIRSPRELKYAYQDAED